MGLLQQIWDRQDKIDYKIEELNNILKYNKEITKEKCNEINNDISKLKIRSNTIEDLTFNMISNSSI